jgi:hypothetical protein
MGFIHERSEEEDQFSEHMFQKVVHNGVLHV